MQFIYYIPGAAGTTTAEHREAAGLSYAFPVQNKTITHRGSSGPDGTHGQLLAAGSKCPVYNAGAQQWRKAPGHDFYVGMVTDDPPTPQDLLRGDAPEGEPVKLGDGNIWSVPIAEALVPGSRSTLPEAIDFDADGRVIMRPLGRFEALTRQARRFFDHWIGAGDGDGESLTVADVTDIAMAGLACSYRVGKAELGLLGLLTTDNVIEVCKAMIDAPAIQAVAEAINEAEQKKSTSPITGEHGDDLQSTGSGEKDGTPATDQPALTFGLSDKSFEVKA